MADLYSKLTQVYPPKPKFTETDLPDLAGKVYIVTGSNTGVGKELAHILYSKNAKVYIAARSEEKAKNAIKAIQDAVPDSKGALVYLHLDLGDLTTIKASADEFLAKESQLHVLFNNAGVMFPPKGTQTTQGYELQLGTNNVGPFLFTKLLTPVLVSTAKTLPPGSVRVVWVSSSATEVFTPKSVPVPVDNLDYHKDYSQSSKYGVSKAGNYLHAAEYAKRHRADGILSISLNPGNLNSELARYTPLVARLVLKTFFLFPPRYGAYTELYAGFSPDVTLEEAGDSGAWVVPWGRYLPIRKDLLDAVKPKEKGGNGNSVEFWEWSEEQVKPYL